MVGWDVILSKQATKDAKKITRAGLQPRALKLLHLLEIDPLQNPPPLEKLVGNLSGFYSRRISLQHRLIYKVIAEKKIVHILRM